MGIQWLHENGTPADGGAVINRNRRQNIDTMNAISVDVEISDKLEKAKLENGFYNLIDGERVSAGKTLSVVNPATGNQLAVVPDIDRVLLNKANTERN
jgi:hypothetical protein